MAFEDHKKRLAEMRADAERRAAAAEQAEAAFETNMPQLTTVLRSAFKYFSDQLDGMDLGHELTENDVITGSDRKNGIKFDGRDSDRCLCQLRFSLPPPRNSQVPYFHAKVSVFAVLNQTQKTIDVFSTDVNAASGDAISRRARIHANTPVPHVREVVESAIDKLLGTYKDK